MWLAYYSPHTIQQLPAGRSEEVMPSLPPILSCATDFTDVGEGNVQGRNLHNNDSITAAVQQVIFHRTNFSELTLQG